jgi:serine/threonine protein kinase
VVVRGDSGREYRIVSLLGEGGMSRAWLAEGPAGSRVVIKEPAADSGICVAGLRRELEALRALGDKFGGQRELEKCGNYMIRLLDTARPPGGRDLALPVLEYVSGISLKDYIAGSRRVQWSVLRHLMYELLYAAACIHRAGFVHRDLRPANVVVSAPSLALKVIDFSTAKPEGESDGWVVESPGGYTAPEQSLGRSDKRSDVYSLGATLLFMLTGEDPEGAVRRGAEDLMGLITRRVDGIGESEAKKLLAFIARAMSSDPRQRFRDAVEMAEVFYRAFYRGERPEVLQATPPGPLAILEIPEECRRAGRKFHVSLVVALVREGRSGDKNRYERVDEKEFEVSDGEIIIIGRGRGGLLGGFLSVERRRGTVRVLVNDPYQYVSRTHCVIYHCNGRWIVRDLSQNGTWVSNARGKNVYLKGGTAEVEDGDYLYLAYTSPSQPYVLVLFRYREA